MSSLHSSILDNAGYAIIATSTEGVITVFNRAAERMLGYSADELVGRHTPEVFHLEEEVVTRAAEFGVELGLALEPGFEVFVAHTRVGSSNQHEWTYVRKDGTRFPVQLAVTAVKGLKGDVSGYLGVAVDISARKANEAALLESRQRLNEAQRIAKVGSWELNLATDHLEWSDEIFRIFEIDPTNFGGSYEAFLNAIHPADRKSVHRAYTRSLQNHQPYEITHRLLFPDGRIKWVHEACETVYDASGRPLVSRGTIQDVTERQLAEQTIQLYANVFRCSAEAILITDRDNRIVAVNPALVELTGYSEAELVGRDPKVLSSGHTPRETYVTMWRELDEMGQWRGELMDRHKDGKVYPKWASISVVRDAAGEVVNYIASFTDITERKVVEEHIHHLAHHDHLTGLHNRFSLEDRLHQALVQARREERNVAVLFIDLDRFKLINDTLGHHQGDELLVRVAHRLKAMVRESDIVARLGGDEFVVVLSSLHTAMAAADVAEKLVNQLACAYQLGETQVHSTPSVGISVFPEDGDDVQTLMKNADTAMYHAKEQGRNNYQFYAREMNAEAHKLMLMERDLNVALDKGQFVLFYQPKFESASERMCGVEALIRWNHPELGLVSPERFIPVCEESGQIRAVGEWVINEACRQLALWKRERMTLKMAVNLSARQLSDEGLVACIEAAMARHDIGPGELEMEVTESAAMANPDKAIERLQAIRAVGVNLSIDDFGKGYSSLAYLKLLPIQTLKLDHTFVHDIGTDPNDAAIAIATISLAHSLGLKVVAEGVETESQMAFLATHGCDMFQGFLFSTPRPPEEVAEMLKNSVHEFSGV
jgi:diguanylate cyclase (GGDEF)-like protein/PAS domain S-box-containing protein